MILYILSMEFYAMMEEYIDAFSGLSDHRWWKE